MLRYTLDAMMRLLILRRRHALMLLSASAARHIATFTLR